jgi:site-specific DNA-methyltransferase (adenine-specific)
MGSILHTGDAVIWARDYSGPLFHALFCDAPYEMGFMGKEWDGSGVAFDLETWRAFERVLHTGAFLFVAAGTINDDLISVAMRSAGLRKFHKMMGWAYGSGFPKASRVNHGSPKTEIFSGHRYGLQALKPAIETILVFQKPYEGRPIDNITETGAGALNIDGGRIEGDWKPKECSGLATGKFFTVGEKPIIHKESHDLGRWPSNFLLLDPEAARALDEQSGELKSGGKNGSVYTTEKKAVVSFGLDNITSPAISDSGGASRFFFRVEEQIDEADPVRYTAKASRREREAGLEGFEEKINPRHNYKGRDLSNPSNSLPGGARERVRRGESMRITTQNSHPTVKPLSLTQYLATLLLPPPEYAPRRIFVPFAGVASEMIGAALAGWEEIDGVEITEEYIPIAQARLAYWQGRKLEKSKGSRKAEPVSTLIKANQLELI